MSYLPLFDVVYQVAFDCLGNIVAESSDAENCEVEYSQSLILRKDRCNTVIAELNQR